MRCGSRQERSALKNICELIVMISCDVGNEGSRKTILANGGVYENTLHEPDEDIDLERYWISLN